VIGIDIWILRYLDILIPLITCNHHRFFFTLEKEFMAMPTLTIDKKKYRIIPEKEYRQLIEDLRDLRTILKRRNEKVWRLKSFLQCWRRKRSEQKIYGYY